MNNKTGWVDTGIGNTKVLKPSKGDTQFPIEKKRSSGYYRHPKKGLVWYDARTNSFRSRVGGPVRAALSIGYHHSKLKTLVDVGNVGRKVANRVFQYSKKNIWPYIVEGNINYTDYQEKLRQSNNQVIDEAIESQIKEWTPSVEDANIKDNRLIKTQEIETNKTIEKKSTVNEKVNIEDFIYKSKKRPGVFSELHQEEQKLNNLIMSTVK
tara:strand:- start:873 stop:1502 length:630 start_codon:yes stop_codon:yes gene_type:complete